MRFMDGSFPCRPIGSGLHALRRFSLAPSQPGVEPARGDQVLDVVDTLVLAPFEVFEREVAASVCLVELACPTPCIPLWLELWDESSDLAEVGAVAPLVGSSLVRKFDPAARHGLPYDLGQVAHPVVLFCASDVEGLVVDRLPRRTQHRQECP